MILRLWSAALVGLGLLIQGCGDSGNDDGSGGASADGGGGAGMAGASTAETTATTNATTSTASGVDPFDCDGLPTVSFAADVQPILTARCATSSCHGGSSPRESLSLAAGSAHGELVGVKTTECSGARTLVVPGDPSASYFLSKARGVDLCGTSRRMPPPPKASLSATDLDTIGAWICGGALDD